MSNFENQKRQQFISAAEGYLDLATALDDRWPLDESLKQALARRASTSLSNIDQPLGHRSYVLFLQGQCRLIQKKYHSAIAFLLQSAQCDPEFIHSHLALAWCYKRVDQLDLAIDEMKTAVELDPESAISHYNLSCYCALDHQVNLSLIHLSFALDLDPEFRSKVDSEPDFDSIRDNPRFISLVTVTV
ncbi:MAG: hypothetical protein AAF623_17925 [Planctomycetota bacterium]